MIYHDNNHAVAVLLLLVLIGILECVQICYIATVYVAIIFIHWLITVVSTFCNT